MYESVGVGINAGIIMYVICVDYVRSEVVGRIFYALFFFFFFSMFFCGTLYGVEFNGKCRQSQLRYSTNNGNHN